jgi:hypothetical protein
MEYRTSGPYRQAVTGRSLAPHRIPSRYQAQSKIRLVSVGSAFRICADRAFTGAC